MLNMSICIKNLSDSVFQFFFDNDIDHHLFKMWVSFGTCSFFNYKLTCDLCNTFRKTHKNPNT